MPYPQRDLLLILSGPIILLIRMLFCGDEPLKSSGFCDISALVRLAEAFRPDKALYALQPKQGWYNPDVLTLLALSLLLMVLIFFLFNVSPKALTVYIQPAQGLHELALRMTAMFMRAAYAIVYLWMYYKNYKSIDGFNAPDAHYFAMQAIASHYIVRGLEAGLLRRYSAPFFPPQLQHPLPLLFGVGVYLFHYFLVIAHFTWMKNADYGKGGHGEGIVNESYLWVGYAIAIFGQVLMLKQADAIPKSTLRHGPVWRGEVISWIGIGFISQHPGVWILVLANMPFSYCEELVEMWTGQRYARLCTPLRTENAVLLKDAPALAEEHAPALIAAASEYGDVDMCAVRPRSTKESSDVYLVFADAGAAGVAASHLDGSTIAGWRANAVRRKDY